MCTRKDQKDIKRVFILIEIILMHLTPEKISELTPEQKLELTPEKVDEFKVMLTNPTKENLINLTNDDIFQKFVLTKILLTNYHNANIQHCYYQFTLFCHYSQIGNYNNIKTTIRRSFDIPFTQYTKIYWSFLLCKKTYK